MATPTRLFDHWNIVRLGRQPALEALGRGEKVIATGCANSISKLICLKEKGVDVIALDVTSPLEHIHEAAKKAVTIYGRIYALVNHAIRYEPPSFYDAAYACHSVSPMEETAPQDTLEELMRTYLKP